MYRSLHIVVVLTLAVQGCAKRPEPKHISSASFFRVDYQTLTCEQLAEEADLLSDGLGVASEHKSDARTIETIPHLKHASEAVHTASTLKGCKTP